MTTPIHVSTRQLGSYTAQEWREIARGALAAVEADPNDQEALDALRDAQAHLREHARLTAEEAGTATAREGRTAGTEGIGGLASTATGALHGLSFGTSDELGGLVRAGVGHLGATARQIVGGRPNTERFGQRYARERDALRADQATIEAAHPLAYFAGDITGALRSAAAATPQRLLSAVRGGAEVGASLGARGTAALGGAGIGAIQGGLHGFGRAEGPVDEQVAQSAVAAGAGGVLGGVLTPLVNRSLRAHDLAGLQEAAEAAKARQAVVAEPLRETILEGQAARQPLMTRGTELRVGAQEAMDPYVGDIAASRAASAAGLAERQPFLTESARGLAARQGPLTESAAGLAERQPIITETGQLRLEDALRRSASQATPLGPEVAGVAGDPAEAAFRSSLQRMGMRPEAVERAVALARSQGRFGGSVAPTPAAAPSTPAMTTPGPTPQQLRTTRGASAARNAYTQAEAGGAGDPREAARRAAAMAREAVTIPEDDVSLLGHPASVRITELLRGEPTEAAGRELVGLLQTMTRGQQQSLVPLLPPAWRAVLVP